MLLPPAGGEDLSTFKGRLRHLVRERGLNPNAVEAASAKLQPPPGPGEKLGRGEVHKWHSLKTKHVTRGKRPSFGKLKTLCRVLRANVEWLGDGTGPMEGGERSADSDRLQDVQRRLELLEQQVRPSSEIPPPRPSLVPPRDKLAQGHGRKRPKR